jgi:hypothetical protein
LLHDFVTWHVNTLHQRPTGRIKGFLTTVIALTNQYRLLPELRAELIALQRSLPKPPPVLDKGASWMSLRELRAIGQALWPQKQPHQIPWKHSRTARDPDGHAALTARNAGISLMLRLWTYIPYRQRNMREMQLTENLYRDPSSTWRIRFAGEQLKVAVKQGRPSVFDLPFPSALVPDLDTYLTTWRPILSQRTDNQFRHVFLSRDGTPFGNHHRLRVLVNLIVYRYTGKHWFPHLIRTTWATEWIRDKHPGDFYSAAEMLNDSLQTVITRYSYLLSDGIAEKVYARLDHDQGIHP